ncbi:tyrosine-type recombinase/integrase [Glutamicibacter protophormiae]
MTVDACALTLLYVVQHSDDLMRTLRAVSDSSNVAFVTPEATVFEAMLGGWESQQRSRGLRSTTIATRRRLILRLQEFSGRMPWEWNAQDVEEFISGPDQRLKSLSTMRHNHNAIKTFCAYLIDPNYDWVEICENQFGSHPVQVCLSWNTVAHKAQYEGSGKRRPLSFDEVETLFDTADAKVEELAASGKKGALAALRDSQIFKTAYAFGLRRNELAQLDLADLHYNPEAKQWGRYAALHVRWGKAAGGGAPRRRTVLLVPEFDWWVPGMRQWVEQGRDRFDPGELDAIWVTERRTRISGGYLDRRFAELRAEAGLPEELTLHSLRHSYVTHLIEHGYADRFVQEQVGHQHSSTTSIYTSVSGDFKNRILAQALRKITEEEEG